MQRLVRHLVDKETAIRDMVQDYVFGGNNLIDAYERERQGALESKRAQLDHTRRQLSVTFEKIQGEITETANEFGRARKDDFERQWIVEQQKILDTTKLALSRCAKQG